MTRGFYSEVRYFGLTSLDTGRRTVGQIPLHPAKLSWRVESCPFDDSTDLLGMWV